MLGVHPILEAKTLAAYDAAAPAFSLVREGQPPPTDLYEILLIHFLAGPAAYIGCGSGRDAAWLVAEGFDASETLHGEARRPHPKIKFARALLPELDQLKDDFCQNLLCETAIMHLEPSRSTGYVQSVEYAAPSSPRTACCGVTHGAGPLRH